MEDIYEVMEEHDVEEWEEGAYYIASVFRPFKDNKYELIIDTRIPLTVLYNYDVDKIREYTHAYPAHIYLTDRIEIAQLFLKRGRYTGVIKTFWLRMFQRKWREFYKQRKERIEKARRNILFYASGITANRMRL